MSIYDEMQKLAGSLFQEFKQGTVIYVKTVAGSGPVDNPGNPVSTEYELNGATVRGVSFKYVSGGLAVASDLQVSHGVDSRFIRPEIGGFYKIDGTVYKIVSVIQKPSAGVPVAFTVIVRK